MSPPATPPTTFGHAQRSLVFLTGALSTAIVMITATTIVIFGGSEGAWGLPDPGWLVAAPFVTALVLTPAALQLSAVRLASARSGTREFGPINAAHLLRVALLETIFIVQVALGFAVTNALIVVIGAAIALALIITLAWPSGALLERYRTIYEGENPSAPGSAGNYTG